MSYVLPVYTTKLTNGHLNSVNSLSLSSEDILASGGDDGNVCLWSPKQQATPISVKEVDTEAECSVVLFAKSVSEKLFTASGKKIKVWDTRNFVEAVNTWEVNSDEINSLDLLESEGRLAAADDNGEILIVDSDTGEVVRTLNKHTNICSSVKFRSNKPWQVLSGGLDCRLIVSDWKGTGLGVMIFEMEELVELDYHAGFSINPPMVHSLACSPSGSFIACGLENSTVEVFTGSGKNLTHVESLYGHTKGVSSLLLLGENYLISGGNEGSLFLWQLSPDGAGSQFTHGEQVNSLEGNDLSSVYVADCTKDIHAIDLTQF